MKYKIKIAIIICLSSTICFSQKAKEKKEHIIYSTKNKNTNLFFPDAIKSGIVGNSNFTFGYKKEGGSKIGILKSTPGPESNLLVVTDNGNIYSFIIKHELNIQRLNYFVKDTMAVGNENGNIVYENPPEIDPPIVDTPINEMNKREIKATNSTNVVEAVKINDFQTEKNNQNNDPELEKECKSEIAKAQYYNRILGLKDKIFVRLKSLSYIGNDLYFTLILENNSSLDYDINYLNFYNISKNKKRNTVTQRIAFEARYIYNMPLRIGAMQKHQVVFVYNKFTINENKSLLIELTEDNGERVVELEIPNNLINNPK